MVTEEQMTIIQRVVNRISSKYVFGYFDLEDIKQQAFLEALEVIEKFWDGVRPLENFLAVVLPNKLKNFKRKHYFRLDIPESNTERTKKNNTKRSLMEPVELFDSDVTASDNILDVLSHKEMFDLVYKAMPVFIKSDFRRLLNNVKINKQRKLAVYQFIREFYENR